MIISQYRKQYLKTYQKEWMRNRRREFFSGKYCVQCKSTEKLELDHINPEEKEHHSIWSWSEERRLKELAKCQVLCKTCHRLKSNAYCRLLRTGNPHTSSRKLSNGDVIFTRALLKANVSERFIANLLHVNKNVVNDIRHNRFYKDVQ